ncbi:hypothetical protein JZ751_009363 [Albula glossodonta]|uniref:Uncharacterized protein n=1 Tax=Albula glossodonta TaxID=121402 RepID=A0A8T2N0C5_9TELE|nr:hypothetical protein JZ751_009363 [Albula glossodonta]
MNYLSTVQQWWGEGKGGSPQSTQADGSEDGGVGGVVGRPSGVVLETLWASRTNVE